MFVVAGGPRDVETLRRDVVPCVRAGGEVALVGIDAIQLEQPHQVREHLVGFPVGSPIDVSVLEQAREKPTAVLVHPGLRIVFVFPRIDDPVAKLQVARLAGQPIEDGDGFKHAGCRHALVGTG